MSCTRAKNNSTHACLVCLGCLTQNDSGRWDHVVSDLPPKGHWPREWEKERDTMEPPVVTIMRETNRLLERLDRRLEWMMPGSKEIDKETE